jgi:CheY-like chemotaxis protein/HPt (histidine-containing phosphotransfer) domain-containing protein
MLEMRSTIEDVVGLFVESARLKKIRMTTLISPDTPLLTRGDPARLRQVLSNLIDNAVKFTEQGEVSIRVARERETPRDVTVRFEVRDTGIGIPEATQTRIFQAFVQADSSTTRKYGGTGLGLAICRDLVQRMGGEIHVESVPDKGSVFWFTVRLGKPLADGVAKEKGERKKMEDEAPVAPDLTADTPPVAARRLAPRILVVENDPVSREVVSLQLQKLGCDVDAVNTGAAAFEAVAHRSYDVVFMDCQMPEMDGYSATAEIRRRENGDQHVAIIALTSHALEGDRQKCLALGMDDYLSKPLLPDDLQKMLERWLPEGRMRNVYHHVSTWRAVPRGRMQNAECLSPPAAPTPEQLPAIMLSPDMSGMEVAREAGGGDDEKDGRAPVNLERLRQAAQDNEEILRKILHLYLEQTTGHLEKLEAAVRDGAMADAQRIAHTCAGANANCGMTEMADLLREIEEAALTVRTDDVRRLIPKVKPAFDRARNFLQNL